MKKKKKKKIFLPIAKIHSKITAVFFLIYLITALAVDPRFLIQDFRDKYKTLAAESSIAVSLHVPTVPGKPQVTTKADCVGNSPYITLSWDATPDTQNYDIERDSSLLTSETSQLTYKDEAVILGISYTYKIIANGPNGSTDSDEITAKVESCAAPSVVQTTSDGGDDSKKESHKHKAKTPPTIVQKEKPETPETPTFSISVINPGKTLVAGKDLKIKFNISGITKGKPQEEKISYIILDSEGKIIWDSTETIDLSSDQPIEKNIPIPTLSPEGNYKIRIEMTYDGKTIFSEDSFFVKKFTPISVGSVSFSIIDILRGLGWIVWTMTFFLAIFLILLGIEHHLSSKYAAHIAENYLVKLGFVSRRKGVRR